MNAKALSQEQTAGFDRDGYLIVRNLFDAEEMAIVRQAAKTDQAFQHYAHDLKDTEGSIAKLVLWNRAGKDLFGTVARSPRIVNAMEQLLRDKVYHCHSKMSIKEPRIGGAWEWH